MNRSAQVGGVLVVAAAVAVLAGCGSGGTGEVKPAPDAAELACAQLTARLPGEVLSLNRTSLAVTGAASWGDPAIVLRCGVPPPSPTPAPCNSVNDVDWVFTENKHEYRFVTFGRTPAVEVLVPTSVDRTQAQGALVDLAPAVSPIKQTSPCQG